MMFLLGKGNDAMESCLMKWDKIFAHHKFNKISNPEHINNSCNSIKKLVCFKIGKSQTDLFPKGRVTKRKMKRHSVLIVIKEHKIKP